MLAAAAASRDDKDIDGLNIEALAISFDQQRLLFAFRNPLREGRALIASIENIGAVFESGAGPRHSCHVLRASHWRVAGDTRAGVPRARAARPVVLERPPRCLTQASRF